MARETFEFYCRTEGGGCGGYIQVRLNVALEGKHVVVCPKCGHEHPRFVKKGEIVDDGSRDSGHEVDRLVTTMAAWNKESTEQKLKKKSKVGALWQRFVNRK